MVKIQSFILESKLPHILPQIKFFLTPLEAENMHEMTWIIVYLSNAIKEMLKGFRRWRKLLLF